MQFVLQGLRSQLNRCLLCRFDQATGLLHANLVELIFASKPYLGYFKTITPRICWYYARHYP